MLTGSVEPFDVAIVLGAMVRPDGTPSPALERRVRHALALAQRGQVLNLLMSGGAVAHPEPEAKIMRALALDQGMPAERVHVETASRNTIQNALLTAPILADNGWTRAVVVTDAYHLPRALYVFRRLGQKVAGSAASPPGRPAKEWWLSYLREAGALPWTMLRVERRLYLEA